MVMMGPSMGKKREMADMTHCMIEEVGSIFHMMPVMPPLKPK
jgi:hypothetical protein